MTIIYFYQQQIKLIKNNFKIFISATEQSGDNIGYNLIKEIIKKNNKIIFEGVGGEKMSRYLNKQFFSLNDFNTMGIFEVLFSIRKFIKMIKYLANIIKNNNYDLIITIDSPDFNYPLIKKLRKYNYKNKAIHIVAPTVWAWRKNRAKKFSIVFDELLVLFNFEIKYFSQYGLKTTFIGHPVYYINKIQKITKKDNVAFLAGSRLSELKSLLPYFKLAYEYLYVNKPNLIIFFPTLPHLEKKIKIFVSDWKMKVIVVTKKEEIEKLYNFTTRAVVCSGTASLEIAKMNIPQIVIYKLNIFTELIGKMFVKVKFANILNIVEDKLIIPEITNSSLNNAKFMNAFKNLLHDDTENFNQLININNALKKISSDHPPYSIAAKRVYENLISFSKAT